MARHFGLRWPLTIPHKFENGWGVLVAWLDGIRPIVPESGETPPDWDQLLTQHQNLQQLAGFAVLSRWADAGDNKNDVLQVDPQGQFWFLDGEYYLGNKSPAEWNLGSPVCRGNAFNGFDFANALEGRPLSLFSPWLAKLAALESVFDESCRAVPIDWLAMVDTQRLKAGLFDPSKLSYFSALFEGSVKDASGENPW